MPCITRHQTKQKLIRDGRVNYMAKADYSEGSEMEKTMHMILDHMQKDAALEEIEGKIR